MPITIEKRARIRHLVGASCAAAVLAGAVGVAGAQAAPPQTVEGATQSSRLAPSEDCTSYHNDSDGNPVWEPPGCTPP